nr:hypothetical protein [Tanacetum cinerariifolium]
MVIWEPEYRRIQSLPKVQGKGKEKLIDKQVAHTLLDLNTPKKKSASNQYILQKRTPKNAEPTGPSSQPKDEMITMTNSEMDSDEIAKPVNKEKDASNRELTIINAGVQDEGQAGSNPRKQDEGQAGSNHESSTRTLSSLLNLQKELSFTDQFFMEKPQEEEPEKTNAESEVQSMVTVPIHQDTSSVPLIALLLIASVEHQTRLLEVVGVVAEIQNEFLANLISFDASYELRPDLLKVDPNGHDLLTSLVPHRGFCDHHGFCRIHFPTFIVEESLSCQLLVRSVVLCCGCGGGAGRVFVVVIVVVVDVDVGSGGGRRVVVVVIVMVVVIDVGSEA